MPSHDPSDALNDPTTKSGVHNRNSLTNYLQRLETKQLTTAILSVSRNNTTQLKFRATSSRSSASPRRPPHTSCTARCHGLRLQPSTPARRCDNPPCAPRRCSVHAGPMRLAPHNATTEQELSTASGCGAGVFSERDLAKKTMMLQYYFSFATLVRRFCYYIMNSLLQCLQQNQFRYTIIFINTTVCYKSKKNIATIFVFCCYFSIFFLLPNLRRGF
jgi:hypothetical protein